MKYTILGCGAAGTLLCLELLQRGVEPSSLQIIDPYFDGGALLRSWAAIYSNTTCQQILDTFQEYTALQGLVKILAEKYAPTDRIVLADLGHFLQKSLQTLPDDIHRVQTTCTCIVKTPIGWKLECKSTTLTSDVVFVCQGGQQKHFDVGKPNIPLEVALDSTRLARYVQPGQRVVIFGLAHSGTLVVKSLLQLRCSISAVYKGPTPFRFARDGHYDGIKEESAEFATEILQACPPQLELISYSDFPKMIKAVQRATWIIPTIGFEASPIEIRSQEGQLCSYTSYSPETAQLQENLYGFGLAYPGVTTLEDGIHKDVSLPSFKAQIQRCLPAILSKIRNGLPLDGAEQNNQ
jgi:hypothetical protein